jgi:hypothetical protein
MKVFSISVVAAITLAIGAATGLGFLVQKTSAQSYSTVAARLDHQEGVNFYGRQTEED